MVTEAWLMAPASSPTSWSCASNVVVMRVLFVLSFTLWCRLHWSGIQTTAANDLFIDDGSIMLWLLINQWLPIHASWLLLHCPNHYPMLLMLLLILFVLSSMPWWRLHVWSRTCRTPTISWSFVIDWSINSAMYLFINLMINEFIVGY